MINGVLFDIDGTLVLSNDAHAKAWEDACKKFGYDIPYAEIRARIGMGGDKLIPALIPDLHEIGRAHV